MNREEAKSRAQALLNVIESMYGITIVNIEEVIETITGITVDEEKILSICSTLNSWVALNPEVHGRDVAMPLDFVNEVAQRG